MQATFIATAAAALIMLLPSNALAYIGPGAGLSAFGALLALIATIFVAIFGFVWYPIKRLTRSLKQRRRERQSMPDNLAT